MATRAAVLVEALDHLEHQLSERGFVRQDETRWRRSEPLAPLATVIDLYLEGTRTKPWISPDITLAYPLAPLEPLLDEAVASWWSIDGEAFVADLSPESWPGTYEGLHTGLPLIAVNEFWPSGADLLDDMVVRTLDECAAPVLQRITTVDGLMAHALTPDRHGWFRTRPWASALVVTRAHGRDELVGQALAPVLRGEAGRLPKDFQPERLHHFVDWVGTLDPADLRTRLSIEL